MTRISSVSGLTANCTLEPPVSTPTARMTAIAWSRSCWYRRSVSVCCGATVTQSPVCTPIGSMFSIEQTITTLSLRSRMTSSSNSPQPSTDWSMQHLADRRGGQAAGARSRSNSSLGAGDAAAAAAEGEGGADDHRQAELVAGPRAPRRAWWRSRCAGMRRPAACIVVAEEVAVLGAADRVVVRRRSARRRGARACRPRAAPWRGSARSGRRASAAARRGARAR